MALSGVIEAALPFPADIALYPRPLIEAAFYGVVSAFLFALWPLAQTEGIRAAALYRGGIAGAWPRARHVLATVALALMLVGGAVVFSGVPSLALGTAGGVAGALILLALVAFGLSRLARRLARSRALRGRVALRLALASVGAPRAETVQVVLTTHPTQEASLRRAVAATAALPAVVETPTFIRMEMHA